MRVGVIHTMGATAVNTNTSHTTAQTTHSGARKRVDASLVGQLNLEWARLRTSPATASTVATWAGVKPALGGFASLADVEAGTAAADRATADEILLALLELAADGEQLAGRTVLQLMLGKAVRIAASHTGRADRDLLEQLAVAALWDVIATYPITRRRVKVAANLSMDTLRQVVNELAPDRHEGAVEADTLATIAGDVDGQADTVVDAELYEVLAWGIDTGAVSREDAALLTAVYCTGPDNPGGPTAAAQFGLTWPAARQRCSRAIRKLTTAIRHDTHDLAAA